MHCVDTNSCIDVSSSYKAVIRIEIFVMINTLYVNLVCRWLFPFIGHMGIAMSSGVIRDFAGPFYVSVSILDPTVPSSNHYMYISLSLVFTSA